MKKLILIFIIPILLSTSLLGQKTKKWNTAISSLENSEFMQLYGSFKDSIELRVATFHTNKDILSTEDVEFIKKEYIETQKLFNAILNGIKNDFSDKDMRKIIEKNPDKYTKYLGDELEDCYKNYLNTCQKNIDFMIEPTEGAFGISEIGLIVGLVSEVWKIMDKHKKDIAKMSESYFENNFCVKNRLKNWDSY